MRHAPAGSGFTAGDLVAGVVRRPDPVPCGACAHGHFDMCRNGRYTERGIKEHDGYASQRWRVEAGYAVRLYPRLAGVGVLMEPTSVVAKAWDQIERIGRRSWFDPQRVLVTGAGPIGLLAALLAVQRGLDTQVLDVVADGRKPELVRAIGATYHHHAVVEATGVSTVVFDAIAATAHYGIVCRRECGLIAIGRQHARDFDCGDSPSGGRVQRVLTELRKLAERAASLRSPPRPAEAPGGSLTQSELAALGQSLPLARWRRRP